MTGLSVSKHREVARWAISAAIVALAHVGAAMALVSRSERVEPSEPVAALVIDLAPMPAAPPAPAADVAPGPVQEQSEAPSEPVVETAEISPPRRDLRPSSDLAPLLPELAPAPKPEVAIAPPSPEPPEAEKPKPRPGAKVTSAPRPSQQIAATPAAPAQGRPTVSNLVSVPSWRSQLVAHLERHKRYPAEAQSRREQGVAQLAFSIDRGGRVISARIVRSSGSSTLDSETLALVRRASPLPAPPLELPGATISLTVPVRFNIR